MDKPTIIQSAIESIKLQAQSIDSLQYFIDENFENAVNSIYKSTGRVVITGIGKSAIIAQKIVATLNSTGTPSLYMHAADAIHGDLGMIQSDDIIIIISKSGESPEIKALMPYLKSTKNLCIAIVGNMFSFLAQQADIVLNSTVQQEACPNNLAPTTSTTAQLVIGDALSICLMNLNNFTGQDFAKYHPGGNLGKRLSLKVSDIYIHNSKPKVLPTTSTKEVIVEISKHRLGATAVINDAEELVAIITDGDLRRMLDHNDSIKNIVAGDIATYNPKSISANSLATEALTMFQLYDITQLPVVENNQYLGIIHLHDLIKEGIL
jgi:arabinose-5-phosphate isomerase